MSVWHLLSAVLFGIMIFYTTTWVAFSKETLVIAAFCSVSILWFFILFLKSNKLTFPEFSKTIQNKKLYQIMVDVVFGKKVVRGILIPALFLLAILSVYLIYP